MHPSHWLISTQAAGCADQLLDAHGRDFEALFGQVNDATLQEATSATATPSSTIWPRSATSSASRSCCGGRRAADGAAFERQGHTAFFFGARPRRPCTLDVVLQPSFFGRRPRRQDAETHPAFSELPLARPYRAARGLMPSAAAAASCLCSAALIPARQILATARPGPESPPDRPLLRTRPRSNQRATKIAPSRRRPPGPTSCFRQSRLVRGSLPTSRPKVPYPCIVPLGAPARVPPSSEGSGT